MADCLAQEDELLAHLSFQHTFLNDLLLKKTKTIIYFVHALYTCVHACACGSGHCATVEVRGQLVFTL